MNKKFKKILATAAATAICASSAVSSLTLSLTNAAYGVGGNGKAIMEYLDRGIYAVKSGNGMFVSWRYNANDSDTAEFRLYRDDKLIYTSKSGDPTCYQDNGGTASSKYRVDCLDGGKVTSSENCKFTSGSNYFDIKLNRPGTQYSPNDCCVGDVDGDGQYEIFLKWDPANAKDNSQEGVTDNVFIDCYTLTGKQLWRIDLGRNIRAGQHYTQMCVADFDCDGKAELITKTADGTKDGAGKVIGDASKKYANTKGYILDGPEYLTLFDGQTGKNLDTIDFPVPRGKVSDWGDNYGNRVDRMNSAIAYLDGVHPSAVYGRGYYTRLTLSAYDVQNKKLVKRWIYDTGNNKSTPGWGCGNHNVMVADVDDDGKQEVCMGASMIDDNGKLLWTTGTLHGDAMHLGDLIPDRTGQELWICHEDKPYGESCVDAKTGKTIFHINGTKDTGRCAADNVYAGNKGAEFWGAADGNVYDKAGKKIGGTRPAQNFFIYWDGDLEREILDGNKISKMTAADKVGTIFTANGCSGNNGSKNAPCITADLFGDWREELILRTDDNSKLRIWCTTNTTKTRLTTLMHDMQYRMQNGCQQSCYNQPPHVSYYLGSEAPLPARPKVLLNNNGNGTVVTPPTTTPPTTTPPTTNPPTVVTPADDIIDGTVYTIQNVNSGMYLDVADAMAENGANIQQGSGNGDSSKFKAVSAGNGYFYLMSQLGDGKTYALDVSKKSADDGTNITIYTFNGADNQQFKLVKNDNGSYSIRTKVSNDASCVEVVSKSTESGANVQEWAYNGGNNQSWYFEKASGSTQHPVGGFILGDIDKDGVITVFDMILMRKELVSASLDADGKKRADVNSDGSVSVADAVELEKFLLTGAPFSGNVNTSKTVYYASDMKIGSGSTEDTNQGFKGSAYVNLDNMIGSSIEWTVDAPQDGNYLCSFITANGSADNRIMKIEVNKGSEYWMQDFLSTGDWTVWKETGIVLPLKKGNNSILMTSATAQGGPNFDYLTTELTDEPVAEIYTPQNNTNIDTVDKNAERTIYIAGDSTVQTYRESYAPQQGWGAYLSSNLSDKISVSNQAIAGRSSKSFYDNGRLDTILGTIKKGDYLLIQFGINDSASGNSERYAPVSGKIPGTKGSFEDYMSKYIEGAKAKNAHPILITTVIGLKAYNKNTKKFENSYTSYCNAMKKLGSYYNIPVVDLNSLMVDHYNSIGYDAAYKYHMCSTGSTDMTHFTEAGAKAVAKLVADELKKQGLV